MLEEYIFPALFLCIALTLFSYRSDYTFGSNLVVFFSTVLYFVSIHYFEFGRKDYLPELLWLYCLMFFLIVKYHFTVGRFLWAAFTFFAMSYVYIEFGSPYTEDFVNWVDKAVASLKN